MNKIRYESYQNNYSDSKLWDKIAKVAKKAGLKVIYVVLLLYYVSQDPTVSKADKAKIFGALGYFILPIDLIPDAIPVAGYSDDLAALIWALHAVWANVTPEMQVRAKHKLHEWFGSFNEQELNNLW
ncbi:YkvA family protein [Bacteroides sp. GD17]|uniref:YkvA family protein n=1 Tax=Bacteroides sp. GD17 TaxID=3139826 RepID=UPI0025DFC039|nr:YkvA family protein [uncultured Bacteroides sp.]